MKGKPVKKFSRGLAAWAGLAALEASVALVYLGSRPADPKNAVLLGYSPERLVLMALLILLCLLFSFLAIRFLQDEKWTGRFAEFLQVETRRRFFLPGAAILSLAAWVLTFLPETRFGSLAGYALRLRPIFVWGLLLGMQTFILLSAGQYRSGRKVSLGQSLRSAKAGIAWLGFSLAAWLLIALTGAGLQPDQVHWNDNGIPLTGLQIIASLIFGLVVGRFAERVVRWIREKKRLENEPWWIELAICLCVWGCAAWIWSQTPMQRNFFAPGPYPPNYEFYPFSDSVTYDTSARLAQLGLLYSGGAHVDKPLYSLILLGLNYLSGNHFGPMLSWQAVLLAALPMFVYKIGRSLLGRPAGFAAAALVICREINAYQTVTMQVSHSKLILSEVPTALFLAMFTYFLIRWLEEDGRKIGYAAFAGGTLGLSTLLRHNPWFLLPVVGAAALWVYRRSLRRLLLSCVVFGVVFVLGIAPWAVRTAQTTGNPLYFFGALSGVVWGQRYQPVIAETAAPEPSPASPEFPASGLSTVGAAVQNQAEILPTAVVTPSQPSGGSEKIGAGNKLGGVVQFVSAHFFHNLVATELILPVRFSLDDVSHIISNPGSLYPQLSREDRFDFENILLIFINLSVISAGLGAVYNRRGFTGVLVPAVFLGYSLASALARTSGGRYIVPVDWALVIYYALGWVFCLGSVLRRAIGVPAEESTGKPDLKVPHHWGRSALLAGGIFLTVGLALPVSERLIPVHYPPESTRQVLNRLEEDGALNQLGIEANAILRFLNNEKAVLVTGEAIYPRFYQIDEGEPDRYSNQRPMDFGRLTFTVIGGQGVDVILPVEKSPVFFPNGAEVVVLGCQDEYLDAAAVIMTDTQSGETHVIRRSPEAPLECPLRQPVCDDNRVCR